MVVLTKAADIPLGKTLIWQLDANKLPSCGARETGSLFKVPISVLSIHDLL